MERWQNDCEVRKPQYSVKRTGSTIPAVPELYKIHRMLIYCFSTIVLHPPVDLKTGRHVSIITDRAKLFQYCMAM